MTEFYTQPSVEQAGSKSHSTKFPQARSNHELSPLVAAVSGLGVETDLDQRLEVARILIAAGADVNAREPSSGLTPLYYAAGMGTTHSEPMIQLLLAHGAAVRAVAMQGIPLLTAAAGAAIVALGLAIVGCGGYGSSTQPNRGTASIMVTAQSGAVSHTTTVKVTVQ